MNGLPSPLAAGPGSAQEGLLPRREGLWPGGGERVRPPARKSLWLGEVRGK